MFIRYNKSYRLLSRAAILVSVAVYPVFGDAKPSPCSCVNDRGLLKFETPEFVSSEQTMHRMAAVLIFVKPIVDTARAELPAKP